MEVLQQAAVLHELGDDVDGFLLRAHRVQLDQPAQRTVTIVYNVCNADDKTDNVCDMMTILMVTWDDEASS